MKKEKEWRLQIKKFKDKINVACCRDVALVSKLSQRYNDFLLNLACLFWVETFRMMIRYIYLSNMIR